MFNNESLSYTEEVKQLHIRVSNLFSAYVAAIRTFLGTETSLTFLSGNLFLSFISTWCHTPYRLLIGKFWGIHWENATPNYQLSNKNLINHKKYFNAVSLIKSTKSSWILNWLLENKFTYECGNPFYVQCLPRKNNIQIKLMFYWMFASTMLIDFRT